jgi:hypothetical protein
MAEETQPVIGMSIGATTLAAVTADRAITREPPDGSAQDGEHLLAERLHALACAATESGPPPPAVTVTHPAHWPATAVDAMRAALGRVPEWSEHPVSLISDVAAALTALQANPGLPAEGIIAVCDFGGSGTSITLVDVAPGQPVGATVRDTEFSGELIDRALLNYVVADVSTAGPPDGNPATDSSTRLHEQCHNAKEQLSTNTVTELNVDLPGLRGDVWVTRAELDEAIRQPLDDFLAVVGETLDRNEIPVTDLVAVAAVGGGANIPVITAGLAQRLGVAVVSSPRPHLAAAIGAALEAGGQPAGTAETATVPPAPPPTKPDMKPDTAWPKAPPPVADTPPQPTAADEPAQDEDDTGHGYRQPVPVILAAALAVLIAGIIAVIALRNASAKEPATPIPSVSTAPSAATSELPVPSAPPTLTNPESPASEPPVPTESTEPTVITSEPPGDEPSAPGATPPMTTSEPPPAPESPAAPEPAQQPVLPAIPGFPNVPPVPAAPGIPPVP